MTKTRIRIPEKIVEQVKKEFNYRCAICGQDNPQIHHIDEDPSNNDPENLIPLCPNNHLLDIHNPTAKVNPLKLSLFRKFKDPFILSSKFTPLFLRFIFLFSISDDGDVEVIRHKCKELLSFVAELEMGSFYSKRIYELTKYPSYALSINSFDFSPAPENQRIKKIHNLEYLDMLQKNKQEIIGLLIELLRYQPWKSEEIKI